MSSFAQISSTDFNFDSCTVRYAKLLEEPKTPEVPLQNWARTDVECWYEGPPQLTPMDLTIIQLPPREGFKFRVKAWRREVAKAEGLEVIDKEEENEDEQAPRMTQNEYGHWIAVGDWAYTPKVKPDPQAADMVDRKLLANFRFVEKTARIRKLSWHASRKLHIVWRAPTEEKVQRIQELIRILLPLVEEEMRMTNSSKSG